jgi:perosamine synthetase
MEQLPGFISNKRELFNRYRQSFDGVDGVTLFAESPDSCSNYWLQTLLLDKSISDKRDQVIEGINLFGFHARPAWSLLNRMKPYALCPASDLKNSIELESRIINIPSSSSLI